MSSPLLSVYASVEARDSKTVRAYTFDVPPGTDALALSFDYSPRTSTDRAHNTALVEGAIGRHNEACAWVEHARSAEERVAAQRAETANLHGELHNLMNVVLVDPRGRWRGRWDRNPASAAGALVLARDHAPRGFLPGELVPGRWTAAVECHGVFGAPVSYTLAVESVAPEAAPIAQSPVTAGSKTRRRGPGWYFGEMHAHTVHSDGTREVRELAEKAAALGIDFVALTDHNTMSGLREVDDAAFPIAILPGCELTTFHGHHPIYGVSELVPWHEGGRVRSLSELAPHVRAAGGLISVAHPYKLGDPVCTGCRMPEDLDPADFELFEVWYRRWDAAEVDNEAAYATWNRWWREGRRITAVAARDWHGASQEKPFPGPFPFTAVYAEDSTAGAILEGLRRGRVIMSAGPILDLALVSAGAEARIGESLEARGPASLAIHIDRLEQPAELRIFRSGERVLSISTGAGAFELDGLSDEPGWYRAELVRDGAPLVITNHVVRPRW